jgi:hypothetical protein
MRFSILTMPVLGLALLVAGSPASANDVEDLERKAIALKKEAAELFESGHQDEAHNLERQSQELMAKARELAKHEKSGVSEGDHGNESRADHPDRQHLKERLQDLRAARKQAEARDASEPELDEIREQIGQMERKLAHLRKTPHPHQEIPPQFRAQAEKLEHAARRLQRVRVAAENLKAAEMHDMAHELMQKAEGMEHEIHAAKLELAQLMQDSAGKDQEPEGELQQLRSENEQLRREMQELREVVEQLRKDSEK